ncbi:putative threonine efflux protein [Pseudomonas putida S11]|nr:putative threonine efflux protein [Pseudomonas putida S11]
MWRTQRFIPEFTVTATQPWRRLVEALSIQLLNPKAGFFFLAVFPQFISPQDNYYRQFFLLVSSYALLVVLVHTGYALMANSARGWLVERPRCANCRQTLRASPFSVLVF